MIWTVLVLGSWTGLAEGPVRWIQDVAAECDLRKVADAWECRKCDALLDRVDKEGRCATCRQKAEKVRVCEKVYFVAACCKTRHASKGKCCGQDYVEKPSRVRVVWACRGCDAEGSEGESCSRKGCRLGGKPYVLTCSSSGTFPHGGQP
jgi:hypothetical protein